MVSEGRLPVSRVPSPFKAATTAGKRATHSDDRSPEGSSVLVPKEPLSQGPVESLHDPLVPMDVHTTSPDLDIEFCEQLFDRAHELALGVDLEQFWPLKRAPSVDARQSFSSLYSLVCSQRLGLLVARGNVNDGECILVRLSTSKQAVM